MRVVPSRFPGSPSDLFQNPRIRTQQNDSHINQAYSLLDPETVTLCTVKEGSLHRAEMAFELVLVILAMSA